MNIQYIINWDDSQKEWDLINGKSAEVQLPKE